jgi:hypothetical protein
MGDEGAHAARLGKGQRLLISHLGPRVIRRARVSVDGPELEQCGHFGPMILLPSGQVECLTRVLPSLVEPSCRKIDRTELPRVHGLKEQATRVK